MVFFASWVVGIVDGLVFRRYLRQAHPEIADELFPGILHGSISQQFRTQKWMKNRRYEEAGDPDLTLKADRHQLLSGVAFKVMIGTMVTLFAYGFFNR